MNWESLIGAKGTNATCTAQEGFLMQLGLTGIWYNLSLSGVYYLLIIRYGWTQRRHVRKISKWFHTPLILGVGLALAGIPYYAYDIWGCYIPVYPFVPNYIPRSVFLTAPVALVILVITINMLLVYLAVRKQAAKEARWRFPESDTPGDFTGSSTINVTPRRSRNHRSDSVSRLERDVFWQGFFYLGAYYLTWPILVVSPFLLVNDFKGEGFWYVVFILTPLQGFWNAMVYVRPRIQEHIRSSRKKRRQSFAILRAANQHILPPPSQESTPKPSINNSSNTDSVSPSRSVHFPPPMQESLPIPITDSEEVGCIHESPPNFPGSIHETPPVPITDCEPGTLPA